MVNFKLGVQGLDKGTIMKYILTFMLILFSHSSFGAAYVSKVSCDADKMDQPFAAYQSKGDCQLKEGAECFLSVDCKIETIQDVQVLDLDKPKFGPKLNAQQHPDADTCMSALPGYCDGLDPGYPVRGICSLTHELYCAAQLPQSHDLKTVQKLMPDAVLLAERNSKKSDKDRTKQELSDAETQLRQALQNWNTLTPAQEKTVLKNLTRAILKE